jgi:hypothetical protein
VLTNGKRIFKFICFNLNNSLSFLFLFKIGIFTQKLSISNIFVMSLF